MHHRTATPLLASGGGSCTAAASGDGEGEFWIGCGCRCSCGCGGICASCLIVFVVVFAVVVAFVCVCFVCGFGNESWEAHPWTELPSQTNIQEYD